MPIFTRLLKVESSSSLGGGVTASLVLMMGTMLRLMSSVSVLKRFLLVSSLRKSAVVTEHGVVQRHQAGLTHGGGGARLYERVRVLDHVSIDLQLVPLRSIYKQMYLC
jgi:hypothetical protein